ncbi:hypothetical protein [Methylacidimicrobium sp. B4]|uniref:hypothetical protein n=1 Tax=Methylacidimicrobium sp. B4 TaxID=2796139 RepID=UPI001A8DC3A1|nr:hypothetical protein MacB4_02405 [Methylacidimicrobium sp. B4]
MRRGEVCTVSGDKDDAGKPLPVVIVQDGPFDGTESRLGDGKKPVWGTGFGRWSFPGARAGGVTLPREAVIGMLSREISVSAMAERLEEQDPRLWRVVGHYGEKGYRQEAGSEVTRIPTSFAGGSGGSTSGGLLPSKIP